MRLRGQNEVAQPTWLLFDVEEAVACIRSGALVVIAGSKPLVKSQSSVGSPTKNEAYKLFETIAFQLTGISQPYSKLEKNFRGKPLLPAPWSFSLSHTESEFLLAFAKTQTIGVDVETPNVVETLSEPSFAALVEGALSPLERSIWMQSPTRAYFLKLWTLKEAYLKATGVGLVDHVDCLDVIQPTRQEVQPYCLTDTHFDFRSFMTPTDAFASLVVGTKAAENLQHVFFRTT